MISSAKHRHTNKLIGETSPYLLQHAHNPVDWHPWEEDALQRAKKENKPIFLSIGYAACHWCHVMERESFANEEIAEILNRHFISIKVDREERPDLDDIYMTAVVAISGSGGWPMTVFLTPDLKPFFGGTYFPPEDRWGRIGFKNLILRLADFWRDDRTRTKLLEDAETLKKVVEQRTSIHPPVSKEAQPEEALLNDAARQLEMVFDREWGGFGSAPKFPPSNAISFLLRDHFRTGKRHSLEMAALTLDKMHEGGMYDHLAGGFHRYSVDNEWLVPHFEKMLYDNAQLAIGFIEAYQVTGNNNYARTAREIFDYAMTYMTGPEGEIYSSEDADSQGKEGLFYLWARDEIDGILGREEAEILSRCYNVDQSGNFSSHEAYHKGLNILHIRGDTASLAEEFHMSESQLETRLQGMRKKLLEARDKRERPGLDDKIITSWNALMISAFARGYQAFEDERYLKAAERAAAFVTEKMRTQDGKLLRTHRGGKSKLYGYLEDYAYSIRAFIDLYESGFDHKWLFAAGELTEKMIAQFWEDNSTSLFNTSHYHTHLIVRTQSANDSATPSPIGVTVESFLRLGKLFARKDYLEKAHRLLVTNLPYMQKNPQGYLTLLMAMDFLIHRTKEIAIVGRRNSTDTEKLFKAVNSLFIPHRIITFLDPESLDRKEVSKKIPILSGREMVDGKATAYVCENYTCRLPVTTPDALIAQLSAK
jgi:uncharacterized protein YyaL (SSP411 family)